MKRRMIGNLMVPKRGYWIVYGGIVLPEGIASFAEKYGRTPGAVFARLRSLAKREHDQEKLLHIADSQLN